MIHLLTFERQFGHRTVDHLVILVVLVVIETAINPAESSSPFARCGESIVSRRVVRSSAETESESSRRVK